MNQKSLSEPNHQEKPDKFILDATAGYRMMWKNKKHPNALYIDLKKECSPDAVQDFRCLPYADSTFKLVVFDPPHIIQNAKGNMVRDFGALNPDTWAKDLDAGFRECWRVLEDYGILIFKWSELCHKRLSQIEPYFPAEPLFTQITKNTLDSRGRTSRVYWCCFMKIKDKKRGE